MSKLEVAVPHKLAKEEAVSRIQQLMTKMQQEQKDIVQNVKEEWNGNRGQFSFTAKGFNVAGTIDVNDNEVVMNSELPMMLSFFKDTIANVIKDKAGKLLS